MKHTVWFRESGYWTVTEPTRKERIKSVKQQSKQLQKELKRLEAK